MQFRRAFVPRMLGHGSGSATEIAIEARNPRPFGYVVGDIFEQEITLFASAHAALLDQKKLPKPGRLNAWLELREIVDYRNIGCRQPSIYRIKLTYQFPNSATGGSRYRAAGALIFIFRIEQETVEIRSTEWPITVGPITPAGSAGSRWPGSDAS